MTFNMQYATQRAAGNNAAQFDHRGPESFVLPYADRHPGFPARLDHGERIGKLERKRFFTKHRFSGGSHLFDKFAVGRVGGGDSYDLHLRISERGFEGSTERQAFFLCEIAYGIRLLTHTMHEADLVAFALNGADDIFPPPAETDDCG